MLFLQEFARYHSLRSIILISSIILIHLIISFVLVPKSNWKLPHFSFSFEDISSATSLDHIVFGIASNNVSWHIRKNYLRLWWKPKTMRGCVFLDHNTTSSDQDNLLPPLCMSRDTTNFLYAYKGGPRSAIRVRRGTYDDTVFFPENLVKVLSKYDYKLWYYIGSNSESFTQNSFFSFDMAYGGGGFAISYPLATNFSSCINRYPGLYGSDARITSCLAELGVTLTKEPGFHQVDMRGDLFGLLAAHPVAPLISLHHLDIMNPIFPYMTSSMKALEHLYEAAEHDPQRIMQQTVCYDRWFLWTVNVPLPYLLRAQKTFRPFQMDNYMNNYYNIDVREYEADRCRRAVVFYMDQVSSSKRGEIQSVYRNNALQSMYAKLIHANCSRRLALPLKLEEIRVFSNKYNPSFKQLLAPRRLCCEVLPSSRGKVMEIAVRECKDEEWTYMPS
ncbi:hypothetical protein DCAR_0310944 [Daucus carota subsp. sativus]|uniref:Uncharacterized protein n=1 Tax=Daucus carota subsp. sativus TaxID=79200 RepID=A0AAF1AQF8_DAUCS|nr:hypothetical protein DCAR_0310944 [Daucus carota subsp. sativus]